jgi:hypothetical protein
VFWLSGSCFGASISSLTAKLCHRTNQLKRQGRLGVNSVASSDYLKTSTTTESLLFLLNIGVPHLMPSTDTNFMLINNAPMSSAAEVTAQELGAGTRRTDG